MTPSEQQEAMTDRIVREALASVRTRHYTEQTRARRVQDVCDEASEARRVAWRRLEEWRV